MLLIHEERAVSGSHHRRLIIWNLRTILIPVQFVSLKYRRRFGFCVALFNTNPFPECPPPYPGLGVHVTTLKRPGGREHASLSLWTQNISPTVPPSAHSIPEHGPHVSHFLTF